MVDRWYNSELAQWTGMGAAILAVTFGVGKGCGCSLTCAPSASELELARINKGYTLKQEDLNGNGVPELFYEINGIKYFSSIDGKSLEQTLVE